MAAELGEEGEEGKPKRAKSGDEGGRRAFSGDVPSASRTQELRDPRDKQKLAILNNTFQSVKVGLSSGSKVGTDGPISVGSLGKFVRLICLVSFGF